MLALAQEAGSNAGNESENEEDEGSGGEGPGSEGSGGEGSSSEEEGSCSKGKVSGSREDGSCSSESEEETGKVQSDNEMPEGPSEADPNASQAIPLPKISNKDSEDEWKNSCH